MTPEGHASSFFRPGGLLAGAHEAYEHRPGQVEMAGAVERVLEHGGSLMVEAATGTGKTLAYLVPALGCGRRVIVSTGTRNLQDQIYGKDIPFLRRRTGLELSACVMKGRENYLCRFRMAQVEREPLLEDLGEAPWVGRIAEWSRSTRTGDRAELADLPDRLKLWRDVNARADTCSGSKCPEYEPCWLTRMKRTAQESQIVVVNHHLFFADLAVRSAYGAVLPEYDSVVFDEAHLLEEVATLYFGVQVSSAQVEELARQAERIAARSSGPARSGGGAGALRQAAAEFFLVLRERLRGAAGRARFEPSDRGGPDLEAEWAVLSEALDDLGRQASRGGAAVEGAEAVTLRADEVREGLRQVLGRDDPAFVYGMELRGRTGVVLTASPIDIGELLRVNLFENLHASVLTSATMAVQERFDFFRDRLGLEEAETAIVPSSFDYPEQALLYLPRRMPEPNRPDFVERAVAEIVQLLEASDGRAFLLFTSYANMERVHDALLECDRWPLLLQGDGSKVALVERFKETPRAVLCGTTSFWHGVDVPGEALSLVVVDKLPFDVPSDPLIAARIDRIRTQGGNPFVEYQLPLAVLELKQGLGRLLRSRSDRGVLAVLDPRLTTRRYGRTFLASLPAYRIVRDPRACAEFFNRGRIEIIEGDITELEVDAVVNAANTGLLGGGGVDGAIHRAAGPGLLSECRELGGCPTGQARITGGHELPARYVIHAVGPVWRGGAAGEGEQLAGCYRRSLELAVKHGARTVAFPAISCGAYGYPLDRAACIAVSEVSRFLREHDEIAKVYLVCFGQQVTRAYRAALAEPSKGEGLPGHESSTATRRES